MASIQPNYPINSLSRARPPCCGYYKFCGTIFLLLGFGGISAFVVGIACASRKFEFCGEIQDTTKSFGLIMGGLVATIFFCAASKGHFRAAENLPGW